MAITGDGTEKLNTLIKNFSKLPNFAPEMVKEAIPTLEKLLAGSTTGNLRGKEGPVRGTVEPRPVGWAGRRYVVDGDLLARIVANTRVETRGLGVRVTTVGNDHLRPIVPVGELPLKWRGALSAKINGAIRRHLRASQPLVPETPQPVLPGVPRLPKGY